MKNFCEKKKKKWTRVSIPYFQDISPLLKELPKDRIFVEFKGKSKDKNFFKKIIIIHEQN